MSTGMPAYWMDEVSGRLRPVITAYLTGQRMTAYDIGIMRVYLRRWIEAPRYVGSMVDVLRTQVDDITDREDIRRWLDRALDAGIDPL